MLTALLVLLPQVGCTKKEASKRINCFDVRVGDNSPGTIAIFFARRCQAGGVTWAPLLDVLVRRRGSVAVVNDTAPGWTGGVYTLNGSTRFSIDDPQRDVPGLCACDGVPRS